MTSAEVRSKLVHTLGLDLVVPERDSELLGEILPQAPSRWYLTGFLVPIDADEVQRVDAAALEEVDELSDSGGIDNATMPEPGGGTACGVPVLDGFEFPGAEGGEGAARHDSLGRL